MTRPIGRIVALGSSFAAGPGIKPTINRAAGRSGRNYAHLVADRLGAELIDATVSGATTENIVSVPQRALLHTFEPQINSVHSAADLVLVTAGGNDLQYLGDLTKVALAGWLRRLPLARPLARRARANPISAVTPEKVEQATTGLVTIVEQVRLRAPHARIVLVDYLTILGPDTVTTPTVPLTAGQIEHFQHTAGLLRGAFAAAAQQSGAELVEASRLSTAHAVGSSDPWVSDFRPSLRPLGLAPFHPNAAGMRAVAEAILDQVA